MSRTEIETEVRQRFLQLAEKLKHYDTRLRGWGWLAAETAMEVCDAALAGAALAVASAVRAVKGISSPSRAAQAPATTDAPAVVPRRRHRCRI